MPPWCPAHRARPHAGAPYARNSAPTPNTPAHRGHALPGRMHPAHPSTAPRAASPARQCRAPRTPSRSHRPDPEKLRQIPAALSQGACDTLAQGVLTGYSGAACAEPATGSRGLSRCCDTSSQELGALTGVARRRHEDVRARHEDGRNSTRRRHGSRGRVSTMRFSPAVDPRLVVSVVRCADLGSSAAVWRRLRRSARRLGTTTPCYESVRKLVVCERERRARIIATVATALEIATRRIPVLPEDVPRIYARRLAHSRSRLRAPASRAP